MATVPIEIDLNEDALYDYLLSVNGEPVGADGNYTSEAHAESAALAAANQWRLDRKSR